ncbi:MAG: hypothetical protein U0105_12200 [Candidatus Obscuribacterales bacterium]
MRFLLIIIAGTLTLSASGCSFAGVESQKRNDLWEQYTAEAVSAERRQKLDVAQAKYEQAIDLADQFQKSDPRRTTTVVSLAEVLRKQGKEEEAAKLFEEGISSYEKWSGTVKSEEALLRVGKPMAVAYLGYGYILEKQGKLPQAKELFSKARKLSWHTSAGTRVWDEATEALARVLAATGQTAEAEKLRRTTAGAMVEQLQSSEPKPGEKRITFEEREKQHALLYEQTRTKYGDSSAEALTAATNLIQHYVREEKYVQAMPIIQKYLQDPHITDRHYRVMLLNLQAGCQREMHQTKDSLASAQEALEIATALKEEEEMSVAKFHIGMIQRDDPKLQKEAITNLRAAWDVQRGYNVDPMFWSTSLELGKMYTNAGDYSDAEMVLRESILAQGDRKYSKMLRASVDAIQDVYRRDKKPQEAALYESRIVR